MSGGEPRQESPASKRRAEAFRKTGGFAAALKRKAAAASKIERELNMRDERTGAHPLARGFRALRKVPA
jgi:hypothetical protein